MLTVSYRKRGIKISHVWFPTDEQIIKEEYKEKAGDIVFLHGINLEPQKGILFSTQHTVMKDLRKPTNELFLSLGKHLRQYIKRSEKENAVEIKIYDSKALKQYPDLIHQVGQLSEKMFLDKGKPQKFNYPLAVQYIESDALCVGIAYMDQHPVGFSAIIHDEKNARLWATAFMFRDNDQDSQVLSRAHQLLDWKLLCWCKDIGIINFDFGGVNSFEEPNGIAQFKLKFESENKITYMNYLVPNTILGESGLRLYKLTKKGKGMYLLRLDDASEHWNKSSWHRMHDLLQKYGIKPIVAVIPHNEDKKLLRYENDSEYAVTIRTWQNEGGWTTGLHGYNHVLEPVTGGINPVNNRSEFVGKSLEEQKQKISSGILLLKENGIKPELFIAPAHTFDENTLLALKTETDIRVISDTIADDIYYKDGFYFIPQQSGKVRPLGFSITTFCYHPNIMRDDDFSSLELFLSKNKDRFICFSDVQLKKRSLNMRDRAIRIMYFTRRRFISK